MSRAESAAVWFPTVTCVSSLPVPPRHPKKHHYFVLHVTNPCKYYIAPQCFSCPFVYLTDMRFSGVLQFRAQMLDEIPMLYTAFTMVYILLELDAPPHKSLHGSRLPAILVIHSVVTTAATALSAGTTQVT